MMHWSIHNLLAAAQSDGFSQEGRAQGALQVLRNLRHVEVHCDVALTVLEKEWEKTIIILHIYGKGVYYIR